MSIIATASRGCRNLASAIDVKHPADVCEVGGPFAYLALDHLVGTSLHAPRVKHDVARLVEGCENPRAVHGGKHMVDTECGWHYRVGSYRIVCRLLDGEVVIEAIRIGHRQGVYAHLSEL